MADLERLIDLLLNGDDERAEQVIPALAASNGDEIVSAVERRLAVANADQRWWLARALATIPSPRSVALLIRLMDDPDPDVRACVAMALGELHAVGGVDGADALAAHLADVNAHVAELCAASLTHMGMVAVPVLIRKLESGSTLERIRAAKALVPLESHDAIPALFAALDDESAVVTHYAEEALERMGVGMVFVKP